ncbi:MAG: prepilin peptidase [Magnetospirillum sp.]|nr:prepilin peptidase [Magnetospirillum sp.]
MGDAINLLAFGLFVAALLDAAFCDMAGFRIPNRAPLLLTAAFVPMAALGGWPLDHWMLHLGTALAAFAVGMVLFSLGVWGGGDAKLVPAVMLWTGLEGMPRFLLIMALVGGMLALLALLARRVPLGPEGPARRWGERLAATGHIPYGVAIAVGGLDWAALSLLNG